MMSDITCSPVFVHALWSVTRVCWLGLCGASVTCVQRGSKVMKQALVPVMDPLTRGASLWSSFWPRQHPPRTSGIALVPQRPRLHLVSRQLSVLYTLHHCRPPHSCLQPPPITSSSSCHLALKSNSWQISSPCCSICPEEGRCVVGTVLLSTNRGCCWTSFHPLQDLKVLRFKLACGSYQQNPSVQEILPQRSSFHTRAQEILECTSACSHSRNRKSENDRKLNLKLHFVFLKQIHDKFSVIIT